MNSGNLSPDDTHTLSPLSGIPVLRQLKNIEPSYVAVNGAWDDTHGLFSLLSVDRYHGFPLTGSGRLVLDLRCWISLIFPRCQFWAGFAKNRQIREDKSELLISLSPTIIKGHHYTQR
jgi:hypothetical protein